MNDDYPSQKAHQMNSVRIRLCFALLIVGGLAVLGGCAYGGGTMGPHVVIDFYLRLASPVNDSFYYFIAIDADGDLGQDGPIPVAAGPNWGNGWGTGSLTHYIEYHQGQYNVYRANVLAALRTPGGGIVAVSGVPQSTDTGTSILTVQGINYGAISVSGAGMIASATNAGWQNAGTIGLSTNAAGEIVAGSVSFTPASDGGRPLTSAEQAVLNALNAGGVLLKEDALADWGIQLQLNAPAAGSQTLTIAPTTATIQNRFTPAAAGPSLVTSGTLQANSVNNNPDSPLPGTSITTTDFVMNGQATVQLDFSPAGTLLGPPFEYTLPAGGNVLRVTLDLAMLGPNINNLSVNFITTTELIFDPTITDPDLHTYDGLGRLGNRYVSFRTDQFQTINNSSGLFEQEQANDPTLVGPATPEQRNQVDIVDWAITIRRLH